MSKIFLVLDESGNLHKNSSVRYFIIGGYLTENTLKARSVFKKEIGAYKKKNNINSKTEVKGSLVTDLNKIKILSNVYNKMKKNNFFIPIFIVIDKKNLEKPIEEVNILYNYFIKILLKTLEKKSWIKNFDSLDIKLDNKTIKVGSVNTLEEYLKGEFFFTNLKIDKVSYLDSSKKEEIQLADFICNHYWRFFENRKGKKAKKVCEKIEILYFPLDNFGKDKSKKVKKHLTK